MTTTKLMTISALLTPDGLRINKRFREYKETDKSFIGVSMTERAFRVPKNQLLVPDTRFQNKLGSLITFNTVCHPDDETKAVNILTEKIWERVRYFETELEKLKSGRTKPVIFKTLKSDNE